MTEQDLKIKIAARVGVPLLNHLDHDRAESEAAAIMVPLTFKANGGLNGTPCAASKRLARFARREIKGTFLRGGRRWPA